MARGDILIVGLPESDGREEKGNRPSIAVKIEPSEANGLTVASVAMVFQMRAIDRKRIIRKIGELEPQYLAEVDMEIWRMLKPPES